MRYALILCILLVPTAGCTSYQLQRSMVSQAGTLSDLQFQQVLNNLAMFAGNRSAIPNQVAIKNGAAQVADFGSASLAGAFGRMMGALATGSPSVVGSRTIVEQWGTSPVTDDTELRLLQIAYRRAFSYPDTLDDDGFADDLAHELKKQVSVTDDLKDLYKLFYQDRTAVTNARRLVSQLAAVGINRSEYDILGVLVLASNDSRIIQDNELVSAPDFSTSRTNERELGKDLSLGQNEIPMTTDPKGNHLFDPTKAMIVKRATPVIQEVRRLVKATEDDLEQIKPSWFGVGYRKQDIPCDACYVGHYRDRCGERYVWVCREQRDELARFTMTILGLSTLLEDRQVVTIPGGPQPAPASAYLR